MIKESVDFAKGLGSKVILKEALSYLTVNPEKNFPKLIKLGERIAYKKEHKQFITSILEAYEQNPAMRNYISRLLREIHPKEKERLVYNWGVNAELFGVPKQQQMSKQLGVNIPNLLVVDPTTACNLRCKGCWAGSYINHDTLDLELLDRLCKEAKEVGIYWITVTGGEPFMYPHLFELFEMHSDMDFMVYTNGTLIDDKAADKIIECGNISPVISLEGWREQTDDRRGKGVYDKIMASMDRLHQRGAIFGISLTATKDNVMHITDDRFIEHLVKKGACYGWIFHYIPIGRNPDPSLMITAEQRAYLVDKIPYIRKHKELMLADFWNDGEMTSGCIAGGRRFLHITADGSVEPCAFVHFAVDNIKEKSLLEVLRSPFFTAYQKRQPFCENHLRPCPIIDNPTALREIMQESGAHPTHPGAETIIKGEIAEFLNEKAAKWSKIADLIWAARQKAKQDVKQVASG